MIGGYDIIKYMFKLLIILLFNHLSYCSSYDEAIMIASKAAFIQSGYESDFIQATNIANRGMIKWLNNQGMGVVVPIGSIVIPVVIYKRIEVHHNDFTFQGNRDKKELTWLIRF